MNAIRCDEQEYLVWKWRPLGQELNSTSRENAIPYGSSLSVKDGEVAVFVYRQTDGTVQDYIEGPYNGTVKTANLPVLNKIVGLAFGGESPFQAEIYFINLAGIVQIQFAVPYFSVFDPRFPDLPIPVAVGGKISFNIEDYKGFIRVNRMTNFTLDNFKNQVKDDVIKRVKGLVAGAPQSANFPLVQIETRIELISDIIKDKLKEEFKEDFGVNLKRVDISRIEPDTEDPNWSKLQKVTAEFSVSSIAQNQQNAMNQSQAQSDMNIKNMQDMQAINAENLKDSMRINREESQYARHLQSQTNNMGAYQAGLNADVLKTGANSLGQMGNVNFGGGGNAGMNPAGMMTGMMMGSALGQQMAGMMNNMGNSMYNQTAQQSAASSIPPLPPIIQFYLVVNGQQAGPFNLQQLQQLVQQGTLTPQTLVWKDGMPAWAAASTVAELTVLFNTPLTTPPAPPIPPSL